MANTPVGRKKNIQEGGSGVHRRGEGLGTGPVGSGSSGSFGGGTGGGTPQRSGGSRSPLGLIIILAIVLLGGGGGLTTLLGGSGGGSDSYYQNTGSTYTNDGPSTGSSAGTGSFTETPGLSSGMSGLFGSLYGGSGATSSASWIETPNTGVLNREVAAGARDKRTVIKGGGQDVVTILLYMCGTDLESKNSMATKDLQEMLAAAPSDKINLIVYTGGCKSWRNNVVSSSTNQIYQVKDSQLVRLRDDLGSLPMTDENTLSGFIQWGARNFPADRYALILWDHGGGSVSGYGYDEKFVTSGSMPLDAIDRALTSGGVDFDFIGFDACLMATVETGLMAADHADYMIASEETEPGVGWYYTTWLNDLAANTSIDTRDLGKSIIDSFTSTCASTCPGQKTTLSLTDLAELSATVDKELADFSAELSQKVDAGDYSEISTARTGAREFAASSKIDQIDVVNFTKNLGTKEAEELAEAVKSAVKYNRTSSNMTNAFGLSIFFPMKGLSKVDTMVKTLKAIGMDDNYSTCIRKVAKYGAMGQYASGGTSYSSPVTSLFGSSQSSSSYAGSSSDAMMQLFTSFLGAGDFSSIGLGRSNSDFMSEELDLEQAAADISSNIFDPSLLPWKKDSDGCDILEITDEQWDLVRDLDLSMFYDDGEGYVDLGLDNTFEVTESGALVAPDDRTWLAINDQVVAYYRLDTATEGDKYTITGRVPALLNGDRVNLILVFDSQHEDGYVAGAVYDYEDETETVAKSMTEIEDGDRIDFLCDFYDRNGNFKDNYFLGEQMTVHGGMSDMTIKNLSVGDGEVRLAFKFTDIYGQESWTQSIIK